MKDSWELFLMEFRKDLQRKPGEIFGEIHEDNPEQILKEFWQKLAKRILKQSWKEAINEANFSSTGHM